MAIYRFSPESLIDEVRVVKNSAGGRRATLHARDGASADQLSAIQSQLNAQGLKCVPLSEDGKHYLEVRGFKKPEDILAKLSGHTTGNPTVTETPDDKPTRSERFQALTLKATGVAYNLGDIAYMVYALKGHKHEKSNLRKMRALTDEGVAVLNKELRAEALLKNRTHVDLNKDQFVANATDAFKGAQLDIGGGIGYAIGGTVLSLFASKDQSQGQIKDGVGKIRQFMQKEEIGIPQDSAAHAITQKERASPLKKLHSFISKHPSEVLNTVYTGVGILLATASLQKIKGSWVKSAGLKQSKDVYNDVKDIGLGAITMTSALTGLLVKEKKPEPGAPKRKGLGGVWDWIQEKPLRATGVGYFISTLFHAWATYGKYKEGNALVRDTVKYRAAFVGANILAEALLFSSSKGHGQGVKTDNSVENTIIATTAELVAQQPEKEQANLIERLAGHMASPDIIGGKAEDIAAKLHTQLTAIKQNPWLSKSQPHAVAASETTTPAKEESVPSARIEAASVTHGAQVSSTPQAAQLA